MKVYVAKQNIIMISDPPTVIHRGQVFLINSLSELPDFGFLYGDELNPEEACLLDWEEFEMIARSV